MKKQYLFLVLLTSLSLTACGGDFTPSSSAVNTESFANNLYSVDSAAGDSLSFGTSYESDSINNSVTQETSSNKDIETAAKQETESSKKIIRTVNLDIETTKFNDGLTGLTKAVTDAGGYIESSEQYGSSIDSDSRRSATMTVRIPQEKLDDFVNAANEIGNITYKNESTEDVTLQYADIEDHIKTLNIEQERLWTLLEKAESIDTIIALEQRLSNIRYELESYQTQLKRYDNKVTYSTVRIDLTEVKIYTPAAKQGLGSRIVSGLKEKTMNVLDFLQDFIVEVVINIPVYILLAAFVFVIYVIVKLIDKQAKKHTKKVKKKNKKSASVSEPASEKKSSETTNAATVADPSKATATTTTTDPVESNDVPSAIDKH